MAPPEDPDVAPPAPSDPPLPPERPDEAGTTPPGRDPEPTVVVYWRPGCVFCSSLRHRLRKAGVPTLEIDIHRHPQAAAFVRMHAGGNETVPTVDVAGTVLVNPSAPDVVRLARAAGIAMPDEPRRWWQRGAFGQHS